MLSIQKIFYHISHKYKNMNVYHIITHEIDSYMWWDFRDMHHAVNTFISEVQKQNSIYTHILVCFSKSHSNITHYTHDDWYEIIVFPWWGSKIHYFQYSKQLLNFLSFQDGIFHIHGVSNFFFDIVSLKLTSKKTIAHHRGGHFTWKAFPLSFFQYILFLPIILRFHNTIIVENKYRKDIYKKYYFIPEKDIHVFWWRINNIFLQEHRNNFQRKRKNILYVGRLEKNKGFLDTLKIFLELSPHYTIHLDIIWEGSQQHAIPLEHPHIHYHGFIAPKSLLNFYKKADILISPTYSESFGLVIAEAMSMGIPVISTYVDGPRSYIEHGKNGFLTFPGNTKTFKKYIIQLLEKPELWKEIWEKGRETIRILQNNTQKKISEDIYLKL